MTFIVVFVTYFLRQGHVLRRSTNYKQRIINFSVNKIIIKWFLTSTRIRKVEKICN